MKEIFGAINRLQAELKPAIKDSTNPHFKSNYADLSSVWEAVQPLLSKNQLCVVQLTTIIEGEPCLKTIIGHSSGEQLESLYPLRPTKQDPQGYGSALTYARRYCLAAALGVVQDDDDGNQASAPAPKQNTRNVPKKETSLAESLKACIEAAQTVAELENIWKTTIEPKKRALGNGYESLVKSAATRKKSIMSQHAGVPA